MCNLYSMPTSVEAFRAFVKAFEIDEKRRSNFPPLPGVFTMPRPSSVTRRTAGC